MSKPIEGLALATLATFPHPHWMPAELWVPLQGALWGAALAAIIGHASIWQRMARAAASLIVGVLFGEWYAQESQAANATVKATTACVAFGSWWILRSIEHHLPAMTKAISWEAIRGLLIRASGLDVGDRPTPRTRRVRDGTGVDGDESAGADNEAPAVREGPKGRASSEGG